MAFGGRSEAKGGHVLTTYVGVRPGASDEADGEHLEFRCMTGFDSFDDFLALSRVVGLTLSGDGSRLVATVAEIDEEKAKLVTSLWEVDPSGVAPARRLTRSKQGRERRDVHTTTGSCCSCRRGGRTTTRPRCGRCRPSARRSSS